MDESKHSRSVAGKIKPGLVVAAFFLSFLLLFSGFEIVRAALYRKKLSEYRASSEVQSLIASADFIANDVENGGGMSAIACRLSSESVWGVSAVQPGAEFDELSRLVRVIADKKPAYGSVASYIGPVKEMRQQNAAVSSSVETLQNLVNADVGVKSRYCIAAHRILSSLDFLPAISKIEGVEALHVGQMENFWVRLADVHEQFKTLRSVPVEFADEHGKIDKILASLAEDLRQDVNQERAFAQRIDGQLTELQKAFQQLQVKSPELKSWHSELQLALPPLRVQYTKVDR